MSEDGEPIMRVMGTEQALGRAEPTTLILLALLSNGCGSSLQVRVPHRAIEVHGRLGNPLEAIEVERTLIDYIGRVPGKGAPPR